MYLGVGPEQNYTYIAALRPTMAFIVDIRRGNRDLHLLYKALFELASDRAEFVSLLFSRARPAGVTAGSSVSELFAGLQASPAEPSILADTTARVRTHLVNSRKFPLSADESRAIARMQAHFFTFGPAVHYWSGDANASSILTVMPSYASLMQDTDSDGLPRSFLATEDGFRTTKDRHQRNLIVPVVGDFAGDRAIRRIAGWLRARSATVSAFYVSNVETFLRRAGTWEPFCRNAATLPRHSAGVVISATGPPPVDAMGRSVVASGLTRAGDVRLRWSDGTDEVVSHDQYKARVRALRYRGHEYRPLTDHLTPCLGR